MRQLNSEGVVAIERSYDCSEDTFGPMDERKKAPPLMALANCERMIHANQNPHANR